MKGRIIAGSTSLGVGPQPNKQEQQTKANLNITLGGHPQQLKKIDFEKLGNEFDQEQKENRKQVQSFHQLLKDCQTFAQIKGQIGAIKKKSDKNDNPQEVYQILKKYVLDPMKSISSVQDIEAYMKTQILLYLVQGDYMYDDDLSKVGTSVRTKMWHICMCLLHNSGQIYQQRMGYFQNTCKVEMQQCAGHKKRSQKKVRKPNNTED